MKYTKNNKSVKIDSQAAFKFKSILFMKFFIRHTVESWGSWRLCGRFLRLYWYDFEGGISGDSTWLGSLTIELKRQRSAVATMS